MSAMATKHISFPASSFDKFIPYTPPEPKAARRPVVKQTRVRDDELTDIDELIRNLREKEDSHRDLLATTSALNPFDIGSQAEGTQNVSDDIEQSEMNNVMIDSGIVLGTVPLSTPHPSEQGSGTPTTFEKEGEYAVEHQGRRAESPGRAVDLEPDYAADSVVEGAPIDECSDSTPLAGTMPAGQPTAKLQHSDNTELPANVDGAGTGEHFGEEADEIHEDVGDVSSPSECSNDEINRPSPSDDSTSEAWLSGNTSEDTSEDDVGSLPAKPARRQRKQRSTHSHERTPFSTSTMRQSSSRIRKTTRPRRRSPQHSTKRIDPSALTDASQTTFDLDWTGGRLNPQRLTQMNLRQFESGETFMAAVIQDERKVAAFAYDQAMVLIKDSIGCGREIDSLAIMPVNLNSWLLTGFFRVKAGHEPHSNVPSAHLVNAAIDETPDERLGSSYAEHTDLDCGLIDLHDGLPAEDDDSSIQENLQFSNRGKRRSKSGVKRGFWEPSEEEVLRSLAGRKTWDEIGKRLNRPPGGVSQHWRKMQLDATKGLKPHSRRIRNGATEHGLV